MAEDARPCFILLMRHRASGEDGQRNARDVAARLAETLAAQGIALSGIWHAESDVASETAEAVRDALAPAHPGVQAHCDVAFSPMHASPYSGPAFESDKKIALDKVERSLEFALKKGPNAVMVVGHQPLMSVLARALVRRSLPWLTSSVPLARGEVACLAGYASAGKFHNWKLLWTIAPSDNASTNALREKVTAKMNVAGILAGVIATGLVLLLQGIIDRTGPEPSATMALRYAAAAALFVAVWLYLSTVYSCDRILMPARFWGEPRNPADLSSRPRWLVERPPGSDAWIIYQNMLHVWRWQFVPATGFLVTGIGLLGAALQRPANLVGILLPILATALVIASLLAYSYWRRPHLGVED